MLKKETDMISRINNWLSALVEGNLNTKRLPKDLGEFEETFSLLQQATSALKDIATQANQIAMGDYTADISPRGDKDELAIAMQGMTSSLRNIGNVAEIISTGAILDAKVEIKGKDDLLGNSMNTMIEVFKDMARQVDVLAKGDYLADITPRSDKDMIGTAMQAMTLTLRQASKVVEAVAAGNLDIVVEVKGEQDMLGNSINSMIASLKDIVMQANQIAMGDYTADISPRGDKDELAIAMQQMTASLRDASAIASAVASGNYDMQLEIKSEQDLLATSMNHMIATVRDTIAENKKQDWLKTGQNELNDKMRGNQDETILARNIITYLVKYLGAQIGALYVTEEEGDDLKLVGSYAFSKRKNLNERIKIGEGLVGQAAFEKELISVTNLPADYSRIGSAIGDAIPRNVVVSPFIMDDQLSGVIELGAFKEFSDPEMELLNATMENVAVNFNSTKATAKMKLLLEETQRQAEELESQQEELRQSNEDLESQSDNLRRANQELETQKTEIERKNVEVEEKAEELAISSKYKSEFLANMSHELRTPLNSLLLLSSNLVKNKEGNLNEEQVKSASIINSGGNDLLNLINEILDLSKIEAGMMDVELKAIKLQDVVDSLERDFKHMCKDKGLELKVQIASSLPATVSTDQNRFGQILKNLMSNAIKFTNKGSITVDFNQPAHGVNLFRSGLDRENAFAVAIIDTGIGVPEKKKKVIFEAFQQAEGGTARKYGGTGLGLSISRELATLLGGEIQLKSQLSEGSTFTLYLPLDGKVTEAGGDPSSPEDQPPILKKPQAPRMTKPEYKIQDDRDNLQQEDHTILLLIEDDPKFAKILVDQCHNQDFKCLATDSGEEGLTLAETYLPDGIILDLNLPGMDGWSVLNTIKDNSKTRHIPVHIISVEESTPEAGKRGAIGFLTKPITQEQLEGAIKGIQSFTTKAVKDLLVIEDDKDTQKSIKLVMGNSDVKITEALNGREGIQMLISGDFDCIILDLGLPDMTGFELMEKLTLEKGLRIPPVIVYTGKDLTRKEHKQLLKFADSIIIKGVDSEERLLDDTSLFLHRVVEKLPKSKQKIIHDLYNWETIFKDKKVMVVDDDMRNAYAITQLLQEKGITVLTAEDGQRALDLLKKEFDVDLVLMDIMMPGMDGYEATRRIRKQKKFKKLPIIALTAKAMKDDRDKCITAGANDYLAKPVEEQRLFSMMRIWLYK